MANVQTYVIPPTEFPLQKVPDRAATKDVVQRIPPAVYQTWVNDEVGKTHAREIAKFRDLNPELSFTLFTHPQRDAYMREHWGSHPIHSIYQRLTFGASQADVFRYCILFERGGYYFDISKGVAVPLVSLHPRTASALIAYESHKCQDSPAPSIADWFTHPNNFVLQWGFGFEKGHSILRCMIDNICANAEQYAGKVIEVPKIGIVMLTGTAMFTAALRDAVAQGNVGEVTQAGVDFNGQGIFEMPGSQVRYLTVPAYDHVRNAVILKGIV